MKKNVVKTGLPQVTKKTRKNTPETPAPSREVILLAVTGMSPAILTETVWALSEENPPVIPDRVIVLTSTRGRKEIVSELLTPSSDWGDLCVWDALRVALEKKGHAMGGRLQFGTTANDLKVLTASDPATGRSREMDDIRTAGENSAAADFLLEEVRRIVENPDTLLVASIAGGRKTMGALLYACMTLLGRETDRLTHVLVNEPFEDPRLKPKFFFSEQPTSSLKVPERGESAGTGTAAHLRRTGNVPGSDQREVSASDAKIELADVPFVPMRNLFQKELRRMPGRFSSLVDRCREKIQRVAAKEIQLRVRLTQPEIEVNGQAYRLSAAEYVLIRFLAEHAKSGKSPIDGYKAAIDPVEAAVKSLQSESKPNDPTDWKHNAVQQGSLSGIDDRWITKNVSSLRQKLLAEGGAAASLSHLLPERGRVSLDLPASNIRIAG